MRLGLVLVLLLTTAACGARWNEEQAASVQTRYDDGGSGGGDDDDSTSTTSRNRSTTTGDGSGSNPQNASGGNGDGGSGGGQGGDGQGGQGGQGGGDGGQVQGASGPLPCAQPSEAPGVTDSEINLGAISTLSGPVPGLGESALSAIRAYTEFRNATGGVCGRQLTVQTEDDGADNARFRSILGDFDSQVLGIAGGVTTGDAGGTDVIDQLQIPMVGTFISTSFESAQWAFDTNPAFENVNQPIPKYEYLVDQGVETAAVVTVALDQTRSEARKQKAQMQASGIEIVNDQELPISTLSFDSAARGVVNSGADYLLFIYDAGNSAAMAQSMESADADLLFEEYLTAYGTNFIERAGQQAAEGATSWARFVPNEEPGTSEGQTNFLEWMERTAPGIARDNFAVDGWAATYALVRAIETVPGPITRQAVFDQLRTFTDFDANGLIGPINLGQERNQGCFVAMQVQGGSWSRLAPGQGFLC